MDSIIVTGGAGFIGSNFVRLLISKSNLKVVVLDKLTYAGNKLSLDDVSKTKRFVFVKGDIQNSTLVRSLFKKHKPSALINFAAETHVDRSIDGPKAFIETNVVGTFVLLEEGRKYFSTLLDSDKKKFRFLHVSTDEVYGSLGAIGLFSENTPYDPNSPYSASKAGADHLVHAYWATYKFPSLITNCSNNYGPYQFPEKLIPLTILNALEGKSLPIYGDGGNIRDWLYVEDHCEGIWRVLQKGRLGEKYNLGGDSEKTNLQVVEMICEKLNKLVPARENHFLKKKNITDYAALKTFVQDRPGHDRRYAIDASKVKNELGWNPHHAFESGIESTVRWYHANKIWCQKVQQGKYGRQRLGLKK